jgi:4-amino-4-deoxy-L-arabinose transferase-like glycosyltransferase
LTVEVGLYAIIVALALAVRLYRLGLAPLSVSEASLALAAWRGTLPPSGASPLLTWLNTILFAMFGSSDGLARLMPALAGAALVVLPAFLRERIGRAGALSAAALLVISPVAIMTSRTASGDALVAAVLVGLIVAGDGFLRDGRTGWLYASAALLGLGLASGRTIYSALLTLVISAGLIASFEAEQLRGKWHVIRNTPGLLARLLVVLAAVFLGSATAFAWRMGGLGATTDMLSIWLSDFTAQAAMIAQPSPFQVLAVYEPLIIVAGVVGLFFALQRGDRLGVMLVAWLAVATLLAVVRPGRTHGDTLLIVLPLALLGGYAFEVSARSFRAVRFSIEETLLILIILVAIALAILSVADYINNPTRFTAAVPGPQSDFASRLRAILGPATPFVPIVAAVAFATLLAMIFAATSGAETAMRGGAIAVLVTLAMTTWAAGWGAAQVNPGDPREIIVGPATTSPDVRDLTRDLALLSADTTTDVSSLALTVQSTPNGVLAWYLRDMRNARFVSTVDASSNPQAVITTDKPPALSGSYAGEKFTLQHQWHVEAKSAYDVLRWLVYRRAEAPQPTQEAVLWVRQGQ